MANQEMTDIKPIKCETCRFWTEHRNNRAPWGMCGQIAVNSADRASAYLTDDMATAHLHTLPHFWCGAWQEILADSTCKNCSEPIFFNGSLPAWQHKGTQVAVCANGTLNNGEWSHWAEPQTR